MKSDKAWKARVWGWVLLLMGAYLIGYSIYFVIAYFWFPQLLLPESIREGFLAGEIGIYKPLQTNIMEWVFWFIWGVAGVFLAWSGLVKIKNSLQSPG